MKTLLWYYGIYYGKLCELMKQITEEMNRPSVAKKVNQSTMVEVIAMQGGHEG